MTPDQKEKPVTLLRRPPAQSEREGSSTTVTRKEEPGIMSLTQVFAARPDPVAWLVHPWFGPGRPNLIFGAKDSAKSLVVQDLFLAVAYGRPWLSSIPVQRRGRAVILDFEPKVPTHIRLQQLVDFDPFTKVDALREVDVHVRTWPALRVLDASAEGWLTEICRDTALLVVDALAAATAGKDENTGEAREALDMLTRVSNATGCTVVVVHHEGRTPGRPRGYTGISQACGTEVRLSKSGNRITMSCSSPGPAGFVPEPVVVELSTHGGTDPNTRLAKHIRLQPPEVKRQLGTVVQLRPEALAKPAPTEAPTDAELAAKARELFGDEAATVGRSRLCRSLRIGDGRAKRVQALLKGGAK